MRLRIPTKANTPQPLRLAVSGNKTYYFLQNKKGTAKSFYFHFSAKKTRRID